MALNLYFAANFLRLKRTFQIAAKSTIEPATAVLLCELSQQHVCVAVADGRTKAVNQLSYYELKNGLAPETLQEVLQAETLVPAQARRVVISNAHREVVLMPTDFFTEENARLFYNTTFGNTTGTFFHDRLSSPNIAIVHALPQAIMDLLKSDYNTEAAHFFCYQLNALGTPEAQLHVHFTSNEIYITASRDEQLKTANVYTYSTPLDVVYYLLALCQLHDFSQTNTSITLSGLVSEDSTMVTEINQYFAHLHFWKPPAKAGIINEYPAHFFSSIFNMAACVL